MEASQQLLARKIISDVLFHGSIGSLSIAQTIGISNILNNNATGTTNLNSSSSSTQQYLEEGNVQYLEENNEYDEELI